MLIALGGLLAVTLSQGAQASTATINMTADVQRSHLFPGIVRNGEVVRLEDGTAGSWSDAGSVIVPPAGTSAIRGMVNGPNESVIVLSERDGCRVDVFSQLERRWSQGAVPAGGCDDTSQLLFDNQDTVYLVSGRSRMIARYDIALDHWSDVIQLPSEVASPFVATMIGAGQNAQLIATSQERTGDIWRYWVSTNSWDHMATVAGSGPRTLAGDGDHSIIVRDETSGEMTLIDVVTREERQIGKIDACQHGAVIPTWPLLTLVGRDACATRNVVTTFNAESQQQETHTARAALSDRPFVAVNAVRSQALVSTTWPNHAIEVLDLTTHEWSASTFITNVEAVTTFSNVATDQRGDVVVVGGPSGDQRDRVFRLDVTSGEHREAFRLPHPVGRRIATSGDIMVALPPEGKKSLQRVNLTDGSTSTFPECPQAVSDQSFVAAAEDGTVYVGDAVRVFRLKPGATTWETLPDLPHAAQSTALVIDNAPVVLLDTGLVELRDNSWRELALPRDIAATSISSMAMSATGRLAIVAGTTDRGRVFFAQQGNQPLAWTEIAELPRAQVVGASLAFAGSSDDLIATDSELTPTFMKWRAYSTPYATEGTWVSAVHEVPGVTSWGSLKIDAPERDRIRISTRSSKDARIWSDWQTLIGDHIASPAQPYLQIKLHMVADGQSAHPVSAIHAEYTREDIAPTLPDAATGRSACDGESMTNGGSSAALHPCFSWTAAEDNEGGAGVDGYFVSFGADPQADPQADGTWQHGTTYLAAAPMEPGKQHVLRVRARDRAGNLSVTKTLFAFRFDGRVPSSTTTWQRPDALSTGAGTFLSPVTDVTGVLDYSAVRINAEDLSQMNAVVQTRTSVNGTTWSNWRDAQTMRSGATYIDAVVNADHERFIQTSVTVTSDSPIENNISSITLRYVADTRAPDNPTTLSAQRASGDIIALKADAWNNDADVMLNWPQAETAGGATDGTRSSGVSGYWVYVGTDANASPLTSGVFQQASSYPAHFGDPGEYSIRIQTQDGAGNVSPEVFVPGIYRFDNVAPTAPEALRVTSAALSKENAFSFDWSPSSDSDSGVAAYCYHSGATTGAFAPEQCQPATSLANVPVAYENGLNVLYVRTVDAAGNYSKETAEITFVYDANAPDAASELSVIPPDSATNLFAFSWGVPYSYLGDPAALEYCYSVNELPSATNVSCTKNRYLAPFHAATRAGRNTLYLVTTTATHGVDWAKYATVTFTSNMVSPGIPQSVSATDTSDKASERWSITLTWNRPSEVGNGVAQYVIERAGSSGAFAEIASVSSQAFVDLHVDSNTPYSYRVMAVDADGNRSGASSTATATAQGNYIRPPAIIGQPSVSADATLARIAWKTDRAATSFAYCGTTPTDLRESKGNLDLVESHSIDVTGLYANTMYYCKVQSFDSDRSYQLTDSMSELFSFRTADDTRVLGFRVTEVTTDAIAMRWETNVPTKSRLDYGTSIRYGSSMDVATTLSTVHEARLSGLRAATTYHLRVATTTELGALTGSDDYAIGTHSRPTISGVVFQADAQDPTRVVNVEWFTNVPTTSLVHISGVGIEGNEVSDDRVTHHVMTLRGLASNSEYAITIEGRDEYGTVAHSEGHHWRSSIDTRPPTVDKLNVSASTVTTRKGQEGQLIVTWSTDEPATTQVRYGLNGENDLDMATPLDAEPRTEHLVIISRLELSSVYALSVMSKDIDGNTTYGAKTVVVTPDRDEGIFLNTLRLLHHVFRM